MTSIRLSSCQLFLKGSLHVHYLELDGRRAEDQTAAKQRRVAAKASVVTNSQVGSDGSGRRRQWAEAESGVRQAESGAQQAESRSPLWPVQVLVLAASVVDTGAGPGRPCGRRRS